jgi:Peptidase family M1 domain
VPARSHWLLLACASVAATALGAQSARPVFDGEFVVRHVDSLWSEAVRRGTRSVSGEPGPRAWVQGARYEMRASIDPDAKTLRADGLLRYRNRSPDTLRTIALSLAQNLFRTGAPHDETVPITGGISIDGFCIVRLAGATSARLCTSVSVAQVTPALRVDNTIAWLALPAPLLPGDSIDLRAVWHFTIPGEDAPRAGSDGSVSMIGYWYPQFCVYDDVSGWEVDPYLATGEFYMNAADYDVRITAPSGFLVAATGMLKNAADVLTPLARDRLERAAHSFAAVQIVTDSQRIVHAATLPGETLTWRFVADSVRDFAFYMSRDVVWDAMAALVPHVGGGQDTVIVHAFYRSRLQNWRRAADDGRQSIEHFSRLLWPYPWPQMTLVEGIVDGGMEYPMLTVVSVGADAHELLTTLGHEIGHMWFPMQVGSDERRFAWMDEGLASWLERSLLRTSVGHDDDDDGIPDLYRTVAGMHADQSMLTHADHFSGALTYTSASYDKLVVVFRAFGAEYGDSALVQGLRTFGRAWVGRHPYPPDFFRLVFAAAGDEREAFVHDWMRGTGHFDARITDVVRAHDTLTVTIESAGGAHLSLPVMITRDTGHADTLRISAAAFRRQALQIVRIPGARSVTSIVLDPRHTTPDLNRSNDRWAP